MRLSSASASARRLADALLDASALFRHHAPIAVATAFLRAHRRLFREKRRGKDYQAAAADACCSCFSLSTSHTRAINTAAAIARIE